MDLQLPDVLAANERYRNTDFAVVPRTPQPSRGLVILTSMVQCGRDRQLPAAFALGQRDTAVTLLNRAVDARLPAALWITVDPRFAPLHADPRFALLRRRIGLQEE